MSEATPPSSSATLRRLPVVDGEALHPRYVVWELTLACDHACTHCGSRAGRAREHELSLPDALEVVRELVAAGTREVVLIGGEAYLHSGFLEIIAALANGGIPPVLTTGGRGVDAELARAMRGAGLRRVSVSVDGLEETHDRMRARRGSWGDGMRALAHAHDAGLITSANTNINRTNQHDLDALYAALHGAGVRSWQVQLTAPLGRAADRPEMLLQPYDLLELMPRLARLKARGPQEGLLIMPGNNLGYFGPEEALLRSQTTTGRDHWGGCQAGRYVMGIESDGAVKGCPSLQSASYIGGHLGSAEGARRLDTIWSGAPELAFARGRTRADLWGFCAECPYADVCLAGCSFTSHAFFGRPGNNPYCHFRAIEHQRRGLRERLVATDPARGVPFDHGLFEIVVEAHDAETAPWPSPATMVRLQRKPRRGP